MTKSKHKGKRNGREITQGDMPDGVRIEDVAAMPQMLRLMAQEFADMRIGLDSWRARNDQRAEDHGQRLNAVESAHVTLSQEAHALGQRVTVLEKGAK